MAESKKSKSNPFIDTVGKIFDNGYKIFTGVADRLLALKKIEAETVNEPPAVVDTPAPPIPFAQNQALAIAGFAAIGILGSLIVIKILK